MDIQQREELSRRIRTGTRTLGEAGPPSHRHRHGLNGYYYDPNTRSRKVNETEAERARHMFRDGPRRDDQRLRSPRKP